MCQEYPWLESSTGMESVMVEMSLDRPIPFDQLKPEQAEQRAQMQANLRELCASPGQVLVAHYSGPKHPKSDVENLLLYNIGNGCFAGRNVSRVLRLFSLKFSVVVFCVVGIRRFFSCQRWPAPAAAPFCGA